MTDKVSDVSNKTIATLLVAAIVVSLAGTLISLNKIGQTIPVISLSEGLTGRVTVGTTNLSITTLTEVNISRALVDFGAGNVVNGLANCTFNSSTGGNNSCASFPGTAANGGFIVDNVGNTNINVTANHTKGATTLLGGTSPSFQHKTSCKDASCTATLSISTWTDITAAAKPEIVTNLNSSSTDDEVYYDIQLRVPDNANTGVASSTVTFAAVAK